LDAADNAFAKDAAMQRQHQDGADEVEDWPIPVIVPRHPDVGTEHTGLTITMTGSSSLQIRSDTIHLASAPQNQVALQLSSEQWLVIGRQEGGPIEYLDPSYQSTRIVPNSDQAVVASFYSELDRCVSRGHFMLKGSALGILFVNGVPRRGGGIRPPKNWTWLLQPENRQLLEAEELLIEHGQAIRIQLPNDTVILLQAA